MASPVNDAITDAVTQTNVKKGDEAPATRISPRDIDLPQDPEAARRLAEQLRRTLHSRD